MKRGLMLLGLIFIILVVSASVEVGDYSITDSYGPGQNISGWINLSLDEEPTNSVLESSLADEINLIDLLEKTSNSAFVYTCNPLSCTSNYEDSNEDSEKNFDLNENDSILFGLKIPNTNNPVSEVSKFFFNLTSDNPETEKFPLSMDILNDGQIEWKAYKASGNFGKENFGCFIGTSGGTTPANIAQVSYCEKIEILKTPAVEIGAYIKGDEYAEFEMSIKRADGTGDKKSCIATATGTGVQRIGCVPYISVNNDGDYYVCIKAKSSIDINKYTIDYEQNNPCGFTGSYEGEYDYDFEIFARPEKYAASINFTLDNTELKNTDSPVTNVETYIESYLSETYDNDCSNGCIIPIKLYSGVDQQIKISGALLSYIAGISTETESLYDIEETPAGISSEFQRLYLDESGFQAPTDYGNYTFYINLDDTELFSQEISVGEVPEIKSLTPTTTAIKYPTTFEVTIESSKNITEYTWKFENGSSQTTTSNQVTHTYDSVGTYTLTVSVKDSSGKSASKEFEISVGPASEIVPLLLEEAKLNLATIKNQIINFSEFEQNSLNSFLKIDEVEEGINNLEDSVSAASSESDYELALGELLEIKIPESVVKTASSEDIVFYPESDIINIDVLSKISGQTYESAKEENYKDSVLAWYSENIETTMVFSEISLLYKDYEESLKTFTAKITNQGDSAYIIIKNMNNILFGGDYSEKEEGNYYYIDLNGERSIIFSTTENVNFIDLPMFISPGLDKLTLAEYSPFEKEKGKWITFLIIVIFIILGALIVYTILQVWYTRKYETSLFKNRNNLFNLINYIDDAKKRGEDDKMIMEKLKKAGWNSEQLVYGLKKYAGKNTGLPEIIPIGKILDSQKKKNISKQNALPKKGS